MGDNSRLKVIDFVIWARYVVGLATIIIGLGMLTEEWTLDLQQVGGAILCLLGWLVLWTIVPLKEALWIRRYLANRDKEK